MSIILLLHLFMLTFTFGHVQLLTVDYHSIDTPIAELNNHTLREVFEGGNIIVNGDFSVDTNADGLADGWTQIAGGTTFNIANGFQYFEGTAETHGVQQPLTSNNGDVIYASVMYDAIDVNYLQLRVYLRGGTLQNIVVLNQSTIGKYTLNGSVISNGTNTNIAFSRVSLAGINSKVGIKNPFVINQTSLGISSLTVEQMDSYFEMYQQNVGPDDVTYIENEMTITDLTYILGFTFVWFVIIWSIRKVVL